MAYRNKDTTATALMIDASAIRTIPSRTPNGNGSMGNVSFASALEERVGMGGFGKGCQVVCVTVFSHDKASMWTWKAPKV